MKVSIISDVHNNLVNLKKSLDLSKKEGVKSLICCGDLASRETLDFLADNFSGEIFFVFGNMDDEHMPDFKHIDNYKNVNIFSDYGEAEFDSQKVAFVHYQDMAKKLAYAEKYNFVLYGQTHKPWEEML
jgi:putative phosphoesterase